ncbi:MAG: hypothetical protein KAG96_02745 [Ichthyobacteriaceae bacterium]|nr:hypothetical protein [Ichthyobacteriaceae bacterium]
MFNSKLTSNLIISRINTVVGNWFMASINCNSYYTLNMKHKSKVSVEYIFN